MLAAIILASGAALSQWPLLAPAALLCGGIWLAGRRYQRRWVEALALAGYVALAASLTFTEITPLIPLAGLVATLAAWSLSEFEQRMAQAGTLEGEAELWRVYQLRLMLVAGLGLSLGAAAALLRVDTGPFGALPLGVLAVIGLGRVISRLRRAIQSAGNEES